MQDTDQDINPYRVEDPGETEAPSIGPSGVNFPPGKFLTLALMGMIVLEALWIVAQTIIAYVDYNSLLAFLEIFFADQAGAVVQAYNKSIDSATRFVHIARLILMAAWFYRAHANLDLLGVYNWRYSHGWAAGAFFVPIINFFRPYQIAREIWNASDPRFRFGEGWVNDWKKAGWPRMIVLWWIVVVAGGLLNAAIRLGILNATDDTNIGFAINILWFVGGLAEAGALYYVVREIRAMQTSRHKSTG